MPDYLFLMESRLHPAQWKAIVQVQQAAETLGMNVYLAGGAVRDLIGGFPIEDLDFVVEGKALKLAQELSREQVRVTGRNEKAQAAILEFSPGVQASVSMARAGLGANSSQPPPGPATVLDDLRRRDFSINAIGISLNPHSRGLLLDPTNGVADMEKKELRSLHPSSFLQDPIRLFRAVRFRTRLHFALEPKTAAQLQAAKETRAWEKIAGEDLEQEFRQIAREREPIEILKALEKENLLAVLSPRLQGSRLNWQGMVRAAKAGHPYAAAGIPIRSFPLFLHLLTAKLSPGDRAQVTTRLRLKPPDSHVFRKLPEQARRLAKELGGKAAGTPTKLYQLLSATPPDLILLVQMEYPQTKIQTRIRTYLQKYLPLRSNLPEQELRQMGVTAGSARYDKIREQYFHALLEGKARTRTDQAKLLKKLVQAGK